MTAAGRVELTRRSLRCPRCGLTAYPADDRAGAGGFLSPQATRLACLAAASWSFDVASDRLDEIAGLRIDDETIRRHCHRAAGRLAARRGAAAPGAAFAAAEGERRVPHRRRDGPDPRRLARGEAGAVPDPAGRASRPGSRTGPTASCRRRRRASPTRRRPTARRSRPAGPPWAEALGIDPAGAADGAGRRGGLDLGGGGRAIPGGRAGAGHLPRLAAHRRGGGRASWARGRAAAAGLARSGRAALLADGWPGLLDHVGATPSEGRTPAGQAALDEMIAYFAKHTGRLGYFGRLRSGRSIGSGAVEGLARRMGRRLKVPGRGWDVGHIDGMAMMIATVDTPEWAGLWARPAA